MLLRLKKVPGQTHQCKMVLVNKIDAGGRIPTWTMNSNVANTLLAAEALREVFQRDEEVDLAELALLAAAIEEGREEEYGEEENALVRSLREQLGALLEDEFVEIESPDHLVRMNINFIAGQSTATMRGSTVRT